METTIQWHKVNEVPNINTMSEEILTLSSSGQIEVVESCIYEKKWHFNAVIDLKNGLNNKYEFHDVVAWAWLPDTEELLEWVD